MAVAADIPILTNADLDKIIQLIPGYDPYRDAGEWSHWFDHDAARMACDFFPKFLTHVKGSLAETPFYLEPWEQAIIANLFGWKQADGWRRFKECLLLVARKNGKSMLGAGIALYMLLMDDEPGAECYCAASESDQAGLIFNMAKGMIENNEHLAELVTVYHRSIVLKSDAQSVFKPLTAEASSKHGGNSHYASIDELHVCTREMVTVHDTSQGSRDQPLIMYFTTSDFDRESICNDICDRAAKIRDGIIIDAAFLPVIYEISTEDLKRNPEIWKTKEGWRLANPNLGISKKLDYQARQCKKAIDDPGFLNDFLRLHCNIRTQARSLWLNMEHWKACGCGDDDPMIWNGRMMERLKGLKCEAALDLGSVSDLTALVLLFKVDGKDILLPHFWVPREGAVEKERKHRVPYLTWIRDGFIVQTNGATTDYNKVFDDVLDLASRYQFMPDDDSGKPSIAVDRLFQGAQLCTNLEDEGFEVIAFGQGFLSMAAPTKAFEEAVVDERIRHGDNPVLNWMASNTEIVTDGAGNKKPVKPGKDKTGDRSHQKIDGIVASVMAMGMSITRNATPDWDGSMVWGSASDELEEEYSEPL